MKKILVLLLVLTGFSLVLLSCHKKTKSSVKESSYSSSSSVQTNQSSEDTSYLDLISIKSGQKLVIKDPKTFVQLYILFNYEQKKWLKEVSKKNKFVNEPEKYLQVKRNEFFSSFGLKESDFNRYSSQHYEKINQFLEEHPDYQKAVDISAR